MSDVYLYGMISPSTVFVLRKDFRFPAANAYAEIAETHPSVGGEAANSAIVLARLGLKTKLDGNWVNKRNADKVTGLLSRYAIDLSRVSVKDNGGTEEIVITDSDSRTVFGNYAAFHDGPKQWNDPSEEDIRETRIACIDPYFHDESRRAAELCVECGKPYVTLDSPYADPLAQNAAAVVVSHELRDTAYRGADMRAVFDQYLTRCAGLVIFTFGSDCLWFARRGESPKTYTPYKIDPVDTTGAGDSFRGAIAYGLLQGWDDERTVDFASAVAALVCMTIPHALNAPGLEEVTAFIKAKR